MNLQLHLASGLGHRDPGCFRSPAVLLQSAVLPDGISHLPAQSGNITLNCEKVNSGIDRMAVLVRSDFRFRVLPALRSYI